MEHFSNGSDHRTFCCRLKVFQPPCLSPYPHLKYIQGVRVPRSRLGSTFLGRSHTPRPFSSFLWPKQMSHIVTVRGIGAVGSKSASLSFFGQTPLFAFDLVCVFES